MDQESPVRYEDEFPELAAFMVRVFASGGTFKRKIGDNKTIAPAPRNVPRNAKCPCNSGLKTKKCHPDWTKSTP